MASFCQHDDCNVLLGNAFKCDICRKGPFCKDHGVVCIMTASKDQHFDPQYDRDSSIRCNECASIPQRNGFEPVIGKCIYCEKDIWKKTMCDACGNGPFCPDHCFRSPTSREQNVCTCCYRDRAKAYKYSNAIKKSNDNPKVGEWLKNHPDWESEQKEIYMRKAEDKWGYVKATKLRMELRK